MRAPCPVDSILAISQAADAVRELLAEAAAENTTRSYASALRYWAGWHAARYGIELAFPVPEATVLQFVVDHVQRRSAEGELRVGRESLRTGPKAA